MYPTRSLRMYLQREMKKNYLKKIVARTGFRKEKINRRKICFLVYNVSFQLIEFVDRTKKKIFSEDSNKCKRCDHVFRFNETKRPLQRSKQLCEFVFSSGLLNVNKLIDVTQLDIPLCNVCYQYYSR